MHLRTTVLLGPLGLGLALAVAACGGSEAASTTATTRTTIAATTSTTTPATPATTAATAAPTTTAPATTAATAAPTTTPPTTAPPTTSPPTTRVLVVADCQAGAYEPAQIILTCGDGNDNAVSIRWQTWTATEAIGAATIEENTCVPDCASGSPADYPATLTLSDPQGGYFTSAHAVFTSSAPPSGDSTWMVGPT